MTLLSCFLSFWSLSAPFTCMGMKMHFCSTKQSVTGFRMTWANDKFSFLNEFKNKSQENKNIKWNEAQQQRGVLRMIKHRAEQRDEKKRERWKNSGAIKGHKLHLWNVCRGDMMDGCGVCLNTISKTSSIMMKHLHPAILFVSLPYFVFREWQSNLKQDSPCSLSVNSHQSVTLSRPL